MPAGSARASGTTSPSSTSRPTGWPASKVDGEPAPFPPGDPPDPADLLSDELDRVTRDRVYEEAVRAAAA